MRPPRLLRYAAHQPPFLDLSLCFQQWLLNYSFELLLDMEYSFPFRDILKDIHQINSGHPKYSHEYSFLILNISLVILVIHMNIRF